LANIVPKIEKKNNFLSSDYKCRDGASGGLGGLGGL